MAVCHCAVAGWQQQQQQQTNRGGRRTVQVSTERDRRSHQWRTHRLCGQSCGAGGEEAQQPEDRLPEHRSNAETTRQAGRKEIEGDHRGESSLLSSAQCEGAGWMKPTRTQREASTHRSFSGRGREARECVHKVEKKRRRRRRSRSMKGGRAQGAWLTRRGGGEGGAWGQVDGSDSESVWGGTEAWETYYRDYRRCLVWSYWGCD